MIHPLSVLHPTLEPRFLKDPGPNDRQAAFLAFIRAQEKRSASAQEAGPPRSDLPLPPPRAASLSGPERTSVPPPWARAHQVARGQLPSHAPPAPPAGTPQAASLPEPPRATEPIVNPGTRRYPDVPEWAKHPLGPYRQAPPEFGGEWWFVNPFTGPEPWVPRVSQNEQTLPEGFAEIFGSRPERKDYPGADKFYTARLRWEQDLKYFEGSGVPQNLDVAEIERVGDIYEQWGMGRPVFYEAATAGRFAFPTPGSPISKPIRMA